MEGAKGCKAANTRKLAGPSAGWSEPSLLGCPRSRITFWEGDVGVTCLEELEKREGGRKEICPGGENVGVV